jgi:probable DNA metabolism protein
MVKMMSNKKIFVCDDSIEGIFTAIYDAWSSKNGHINNKIEINSYDSNNLELFSEYIDVKPDDEKVIKVANSIKKKISEEVYEMICRCVLSNNPMKGDIIYRFLILGFSIGSRVIDQLTDSSVMGIFEMNRNVGNEAHHFNGFLRFIETRGNILFATINPKNDIIRLIAPHFSDRLQIENFIIYDEKRNTAIIHKSGFPWVYTNAEDLNIEKLSEKSIEEEEFQTLWTIFFETIAIEERKNFNLQRNNLPLRFRGNMIEFNRSEDNNWKK